MTQQEAVFQACLEVDVRSAVKTLQVKAEQIYGGPIHYSAVVSYRSKFRKANKIKVDCRRNGKKGQWRRDMLNDHLATLPQVKRLNHYFSLKRPQVQSLLNLIGEGTDRFHSVEQLMNAVTDLQELKVAA